MGKALGKRYVFSIFVVVLAFIVGGCGKSRNRYEEVEVSAEDVTYEGEDIVLKGVEGDAKQYCISNGDIFVLTCKETKFHLYKAQADGSNVMELPVNFSENEMIDGFVVEEDGSIIYLTSYGETNIHNELIKLDPAGKEQIREDVTESLQLSGEDLLHRIVVDHAGNIILASNQNVYIMNQKLQPAGEVKLKNKYYLTDFAKTKTGQIVCVQGEDRTDGEFAGNVCILDTEKKKWGDTIRGNEDFKPNENCLMDGGEYDFYYKDGSGIYGYTIEKKALTMILDARYSFLTSEDVEGMVLVGKDQFFGVMNENAGTEKNLVMELYSKPDREEFAKKQTVTYAAYYNVPNKLRIAAKEFNKANKDYRIVFKIYDDEERTRMLMDIVAGNASDIIDISSLGLSAEQCVAKGLLEDLTPYYEKDTEVCMDDIIPSVLEGMKIDGKLYCVAPYFTIHSAVGRTRDVGNGTGWTFDEMKGVLEKKGDDVIPFDCEEKSMMLSYFLDNGLGDFINWDTGECSFNSQEFKDILELCNGGKKDEEEKIDDDEFNEQYDDLERRLEEGKVLLATDIGVSLETIQVNRQRFGEEITYIGFPNKERQGSYFDYSQQYGIYSKSNVKDKAWEFIRLVMDKEYQIDAKYLDYYMMPTRQDGFDWKVKARMATEPYTDEFGNEIEPLEMSTYYLGDTEIKTGPVSQEDVDIFVDLMNHTNKKVIFDEEMIGIVGEEALIYFEGDKSLDEIVDIIQQRITTYVNEKR